jgi:hypothetical protein
MVFLLISLGFAQFIPISKRNWVGNKPEERSALKSSENSPFDWKFFSETTICSFGPLCCLLLFNHGLGIGSATGGHILRVHDAEPLNEYDQAQYGLLP